MATISVLAAAALAVGCGPAKPAADPEPAAPEPPPKVEAPPPPAQPPLYERLGRREAVEGVVDELLGNVLADKRINRLFDKARHDKQRARTLRARLVGELCVIAGGDDCTYDGKPMKEAHAGMGITEAQWDAFAEDLSIALKTRNVDDALAKELLDKLEAAAKADIVTGGKGK